MSDQAFQRFKVDLLFDERTGQSWRRPAGSEEDTESIRRRLVMCGAALAAAFAVLGLRTTQLALDTPPPRYAAQVEAAEEGTGKLEDAAGRILAVDVDAFGLAVNGREVWDAEEAAIGLSGVFADLDPDKLRIKLAAGQRVVVSNVISEREREAVLKLGLPGMSFPETKVRAYPQGRLMSHAVGYQIPGRGGVTGLEAALSAGEGETVRSTLNVSAQTILTSELQRAMAIHEAKAGWAVLMNARNGAVAALVSLPDFDPNVPGQSPPEAWRNRVVSDNYELGSAFKALTVAAAIETGLAKLDTQVSVTSPLRVGDWAIEDYTPKGPVLSVEEVLAISSNIGTAQLALLMGEETFVPFLGKLGLFERLDTELPEGRQPAIPSQWGPAELATTSYGHGIAVSPLHLTRAFAAMVNGGDLVQPRFFASTDERRERVLSPETSAAMRKALRTTVVDGTGSKAEAPGFYVIGKTATADKPVVGGYDDAGPVLSSFIGAFPGYDPEWVLLVSLDEPKGTPETYGFATAGWTAAPVFRRSVERLAPVLGLMPAREDVAADGFLTRIGMGTGAQTGEAQQAR
ncbi:MAG: penicillin-binding protein 2 [Parvularcula sp.]|nr:penicillin-binding protein 2 [Parvularcula sp.]